jgi:hypothetical protein
MLSRDVDDLLAARLLQTPVVASPTSFSVPRLAGCRPEPTQFGPSRSRYADRIRQRANSWTSFWTHAQSLWRLRKANIPLREHVNRDADRVPGEVLLPADRNRRQSAAFERPRGVTRTNEGTPAISWDFEQAAKRHMSSSLYVVLPDVDRDDAKKNTL